MNPSIPGQKPKQKPTATVKPVVKAVVKPRKQYHDQWKEPTGINRRTSFENYHQRTMSSTSGVDGDCKDAMMIQDDYIKSDVTAQVLRQTSLTRSDMCLSPQRGINPKNRVESSSPSSEREKFAILSREIHHQHHRAGHHQQPLKDDSDISQRPVNRRSVPPTEARRSQSVSDLSEVNRAGSDIYHRGSDHHFNMETRPMNQHHGPVMGQRRSEGANIPHGNDMRLSLEKFVERKRKSLERKPTNDGAQSPHSPSHIHPTLSNASSAHNVTTRRHKNQKSNEYGQQLHKPALMQPKSVRILNQSNNTQTQSSPDSSSSSSPDRRQEIRNRTEIKPEPPPIKPPFNSFNITEHLTRGKTARISSVISRPVSYPAPGEVGKVHVFGAQRESVSPFGVQPGRAEDVDMLRRQPSDNRRNPWVVPNDEEECHMADQSQPLRPTSYYNERTQHRHIALKPRDRCRSEENMNFHQHHERLRNIEKRIICNDRNSTNIITTTTTTTTHSRPAHSHNNVCKSMEILREHDSRLDDRRNRPQSQEILPEPLSTSTEELLNRTAEQYCIRPRKSANRGCVTASIAERKLQLGMLPDGSKRNTSQSPTFLTSSRTSILNSIIESHDDKESAHFRPICPDSEVITGSSSAQPRLERSPPSRQESNISVGSSYSRSESSSVGPHPEFPLPPTENELMAAHEVPSIPSPSDLTPNVPDDIQKTFDQIKRSSDSPPEEPPPPEPDTGLLPNSYFQPPLMAKLKLGESEDKDSEQESTSSEEQISDVILKHERIILQLTEFKEDLIDVYRKNELIGEQINIVIKNQCPKSVVSKYHLFVEDIESNFNLLSKLSGRILRAEASMSEQHDETTREAIIQKFAALKGQMADAEKCRQHCDTRESLVQNALEKQLTDEEYAKYNGYVLEKRHILEEQRMIEERIRMVEAQLVQLKESAVNK